MINNLSLRDLFRNAIETNNEVDIAYKYGIGDSTVDISFQPYILGSDIYQYDFVWGFIPHNNTFYKFKIDNISSFKLTKNRFEIIPNSCYQYSSEEEHYATLQNFEHNVFCQSARQTTDE